MSSENSSITSGTENLPITSESEWPWQWKGSQEGLIGNFLKTGFRSDLTLILGPEMSKVMVHKVFLQAGSPVLDAKLKKASDASESNNLCEASMLVIDNVETPIFKMMLEYFYTGKVTNIGVRSALPLLQMATEYEVPNLRNHAAIMLIDALNEENVLQMFQGAMASGHGSLVKASLEKICRNGYAILKREEFLDLRLECLVEIIQQDSLQVPDEMVVFDAVYRWGEKEIKRQGLDVDSVPVGKCLKEVLTKLLNHVRFPLMDKVEFILNVAQKPILSTDDHLALMWLFEVPEEKRNKLNEGRFVSTPRSYIRSESDIIIYARSPAEGIRSTLPITNTMSETLILRGLGNLSLKAITIWKPIFHYHGDVINYSYNYDQVVIRTTVTSGDITLLKQKNRGLVSADDGDFFQISLDVPLKLKVPDEGTDCVELTLQFFGKIISFDRMEHMKSLSYSSVKGLQIVSNYGNFLNQAENTEEEEGPCFERKEGDTMAMTTGIIEKLIFSNA